MSIKAADLPDQIFEAAARVVTKCANGQHPSTTDVRFLETHSLPCESDMEPAELAGTIVWRVFRAKQILDAAA